MNVQFKKWKIQTVSKPVLSRLAHAIEMHSKECRTGINLTKEGFVGNGRETMNRFTMTTKQRHVAMCDQAFSEATRMVDLIMTPESEMKQEDRTSGG